MGIKELARNRPEENKKTINIFSRIKIDIASIKQVENALKRNI